MTNTDDFRGYEQKHAGKGFARPVEGQGLAKQSEVPQMDRPVTAMETVLNRTHDTNEYLLILIDKLEKVLLRLRGSQPEDPSKGESGQKSNPCLLSHLEDALQLQSYRVNHLQKLTTELTNLI